MSKWIVCIEIIYFMILYIVAFFSNKDYRQDDDVLWISKRQWKAIFIMWFPSIIAWILRGRA